MKVKIEFTVDIDPDAWSLEYRVPANEVREDVRLYVENGVRADLYDRRLLRRPEVAGL